MDDLSKDPLADATAVAGLDEWALPREVELKLDLDPQTDGAILEHPLLRGRLDHVLQTVSTYYDTRKKALRDAGLTLRVRKIGDSFVQTVKSAGRVSAGLFDRGEWEEPVNGPEPDLGRVRDIAPPLKSSAVCKSLRPVFSTHIDRRAAVVDTPSGRVEVVVDRGEVVAGNKRQRLFELELELIDGSPRALFDVARQLSGSVPLRLGVMTKSERGERLASGKSIRALKAERIRLSPEMTAAQAFQTIAFACIRHFRINEPIVIAARDVDALHQARVALRRLRSAFSLFRPILKDDAADRFKTELRAVAAALGEARNLDVLLARRGEELSKKSRKALVARRGEAYDQAIGVLQSSSVQSMMIDLAEWIALSIFTGNSEQRSPKADHDILAFSEDVLDRFWRKVRRGGKHLEEIDDEARHALRIAGKKLRYAIEFFSELYVDERTATRRDAFLSELEAMQDSLGTLNDIATERELHEHLHELGIELPSKLHPASESEHLIADASMRVRQLTGIGHFWD